MKPYFGTRAYSLKSWHVRAGYYGCNKRQGVNIADTPRDVFNGKAYWLPNGKVIIFGGFTSLQSTPLIFTPSNTSYTAGTWSLGPNHGGIPVGTWGKPCSAQMLDGNIILHQTGLNNGGTLIYDWATNAYLTPPNPAVIRDGACMCTIPDGRVVLGGGRWMPGPAWPVDNFFDVYDPVGNSWTRQTAKKSNMMQQSCAWDDAIAAIVYGGGLTSGGVNSTLKERYDAIGDAMLPDLAWPWAPDKWPGIAYFPYFVDPDIFTYECFASDANFIGTPHGFVVNGVVRPSNLNAWWTNNEFYQGPDGLIWLFGGSSQVPDGPRVPYRRQIPKARAELSATWSLGANYDITNPPGRYGAWSVQVDAETVLTGGGSYAAGFYTRRNQMVPLV